VNDPAIVGRARFYLGETYYFSGEAGKALVEFLAVQSRFPQETSLWIRSSLDKLSNK
jgi:TolA-binding protein